jgi:twitching motility protein PilT
MSIIIELLKTAASMGASDIHITPDNKPCFRTHAELKQEGDQILDVHMVQNIVKDIIPNHMVRSFEETHEADFSYFAEGIGRFRVNVFMAQGLPCLALRHVKTQIPTFEELNLPPQLRQFAHIPRGIVLVSGTTGSGKSTTLAAIVGEINRTQKRRIITIEDPVEYQFDDDQSVISQREIGLDTKDYEEALKHVLRQDPDVILIGEMRDRLSIMTALLAAETGHLVLSTLHSGSCSMAVPRMLDVFPTGERDQVRMGLANTHHAIVCQRLVPAMSGGVVPALEIMINTSTVKKLLENDQLEILAAAIETGNDDGMITFNQSIYKLIKGGVITEKEGMRYASNPESLKMNLQGIFLDEARRILSL